MQSRFIPVQCGFYINTEPQLTHDNGLPRSPHACRIYLAKFAAVRAATRVHLSRTFSMRPSLVALLHFGKIAQISEHPHSIRCPDCSRAGVLYATAIHAHPNKKLRDVALWLHSLNNCSAISSRSFSTVLFDSSRSRHHLDVPDIASMI